ncbi:phosphoglucosamine mutase [Carboxylicivirga sp. N1Y90]|uniref:phosphoglucosamine mutase n=1 Tax=Carboxylicivirga fragile TaxID=3417571 RepID=UPI003D333733|nr:phosphoglucosamine mutase [Marinilabiliaceae bacterium N1Y90]
MTLIKSISGIRGTIGGKVGDGLSPLDVVKFSSAYGQWVKKRHEGKLKVVVGRDARISGDMVKNLVIGSLQGLGIDVVNIGLATTPTTEIAVTEEKAHGGIILTASHNPKQWNALKLLNENGEFLTAADGAEVLKIAEDESFEFAEVDELGKVEENDTYTDFHVQHVLNLDMVNVEAIKNANFTVAIDCVNSVGGIAIPALLKALNVKNTIELYTEPNGQFPHNPEPLPEHLVDIATAIKKQNADVGFVVDPDVDRLAIVNEDGSMFGEEYTLVAVADYLLSHKIGNTVSNLSSSRALADVTRNYGGEYSASAVGEVNVVATMKETDAIIGGEGNGGVIYPESHYGRDSLVGIGLFLSHLAVSGLKCSELRAKYPEYCISKNKIQLTPEIDTDKILESIKNKYAKEEINDIDGLKIDFSESWVQLRKSNTEPIIRIYAEAKSAGEADKLAQNIIADIKALL